VAEDLRDGAPTRVKVDRLLLDAKLSVPEPRPGSVSRAMLVETARGSGRRVVGVSAPAGYGKSTLLAQWARAEDRRVAWVSLDRFDDDPAALLALLASAYVRVSPGNARWLRVVIGVLGVVVLLWGNDLSPTRLLWSLVLVVVLLAGLQVLVGAGGRSGASTRAPAGDAETVAADPRNRTAETVGPGAKS
jgi:hypothetical protein